MEAVSLRKAPIVLLDDCRTIGKAGASWLYHSPDYIIHADTFDEIDSALKAIDAAVAQGLHVAGWISYEVAAAFEEKLARRFNRTSEEPLIWMMVTKNRVMLSQSEVAAYLHTADAGSKKSATLEFLKPSETEEHYHAALQETDSLIKAGDVYQINYTYPQPFNLKGDALTLYSRLRRTQPVAYGAYIDTGTFKILSHSPELFIEKRGDSLTSKPMKGTIKRGRTVAEDTVLQNSLKADLKSQAENLMIVDLIRNDISRISKPGSVKVEALFTAEQYATLHQMTSTVRATAQDGLEPSTLLRSMFPCGSVTGAPKIRAMEVIHTLESQPRGAYCGAIGHFSHTTSPDEEEKTADHWTLNVPIRTLVVNDSGVGRLSVGSGIVADSEAASEYAECQLKSKFSTATPEDFCLLETMRGENGTLHHLEQHLARLSESARYFGFHMVPQDLSDALEHHIAPLNWSDNQQYRIRLLLDKAGAISITHSAFQTPPSTAAKLCVSSALTDPSDIFLYHKTTKRTLYDTAYHAALKAGFDEVVFLNRLGEVTEGAISTLFIVKDTLWYTPPLYAGVLPGVLRKLMLHRDTPVIEKTLTLGDLDRADEIYIGNSLRGLRQAILHLDVLAL